MEKIKGKAVERKTGNIRYLIKWLGYPESENTWEPKNNLEEDGFKDAIEVYERRLLKAQEIKKQAKSKSPSASKREIKINCISDEEHDVKEE